jgi:hypothetical protein
MRRTVVSAALLALAAPAAAQAEPLPVKLKDGASWTQTIVKTRTDERDGATKTIATTTVLKVAYQAGEPAMLRETFVSVASADVPADALPKLTAQMQLVFPAVLEVDEALTPKRVVNWADLKAQIPKLGGDPKVLEAVSATFGSIDDKAAASLFKEQALVSLGQGTDLAVGESRPYEDQVANVLGGPPIKTSGEFKLVSHDPAARRARVTRRQALAPAAAAQSIGQSIELIAAKLDPEKASEAKAALAGLSLERQDVCRHEIDIPTGLAAKVDCTVSITSGLPGKVAKRTERWVITQSMPESR